jgi:hypothetical protein
VDGVLGVVDWGRARVHGGPRRRGQGGCGNALSVRGAPSIVGPSSSLAAVGEEEANEAGLRACSPENGCQQRGGATVTKSGSGLCSAREWRRA